MKNTKEVKIIVDVTTLTSTVFYRRGFDSDQNLISTDIEALHNNGYLNDICKLRN